MLGIVKTALGFLSGGAGGIIGGVFDWLKTKQQRKQAEQEHRARWEVIQAKRSGTVLRWATFVILWGPIAHAYYLAMSVTLPTDDPAAIGQAIEITFGSFPPWWTGGAMTVLLAVWGIREAGNLGISKAAMRVREREAEADTERERNRRGDADNPSSGRPRAGGAGD